MTWLIVGKTEFWTELGRRELRHRLDGVRQRVNGPEEGIDVSFGGKLLVNIAAPDDRQILIWPPDVSAVWGGKP